MDNRASHWSVTINNPVDEDRKALGSPPGFVKKVMYQDEVGEEGTLHIQGYVQTGQVRMSQLKKWLPRAHLEVARDKNALMKYVQKPETSVEGTQKVLETEYLTMEKALMKLAKIQDTYRGEWDEDSWLEMTPVQRKNWEVKEYWRLVKIILEYEPTQVGLFTNPQLERAWINTQSVWRKLYSKQKVLEQNASQIQAQHQASGAQDAEEENVQEEGQSE